MAKHPPVGPNRLVLWESRCYKMLEEISHNKFTQKFEATAILGWKIIQSTEIPLIYPSRLVSNYKKSDSYYEYYRKNLGSCLCSQFRISIFELFCQSFQYFNEATILMLFKGSGKDILPSVIESSKEPAIASSPPRIFGIFDIFF